MKNSIIVLIAIIICTPGNQLIAGTYAGGSGTPEDPYLIETAEQLNEIGLYEEDWNKHFKLIENIDMKPYDRQNGNPAFNIIGYWIDHFHSENRPFTGTFDGNGFLIHNLTCLSLDRNTVGLFGFIEDAKIKDLGMVDVLLVPDNPDATGGLVGRSKRGKISNCYATGSVSSDSAAGGLIGVNDDGTIHNCYSSADVSGHYAGGLAGANGGTIYLCYSTGRVTKTDLVYDWGALVGWNIGLVTNCYWNLDTNSSNASAGDAGKTTYEMKLRQTYYGWGNNNIWTIDDERDYPRLSWENKPGQPISNPDYWQGEGTDAEPYRIHTPQELNRIGLLPYEWGKHFRLMNDIDLSSLGSSQINILSGISDTPFSGVFDGNGHSIANLRLKRMMVPCGLFASVSGNIKNLEIVDPNIVNQGRETGAVAGELLMGGTISNCSVKGGRVSCNYVAAGGLVGMNMGSIIDCSVDQCHVSFIQREWINDNIGGLTGVNYGIILNSQSSGKVEGSWHVGGLTGYNSGTIFGSSSKCMVDGDIGVGGLTGSNSGSIVASFCNGPVSGISSVGGLAGSNGGNIHSCYSNSNVNGEERTGGLVGANGSIVSCSYSTGIVAGEAATVGGLIGFNGEGVVNSSFWNIETSGTTRSSKGIGLTTEQMQTSEVFIENGWDFVGETTNGIEDVWFMREGLYPQLLWENNPPLSDAGGNQELYACFDAHVEVALDGSASSDEDGDRLDYSWSWEIEGRIYQAQGVNPVIQLPPGEFEITLIVSDGIVDSEPDTALIQIIAPVEGSLFFVPQAINTNSKGKNILAILTLPKGIQIEDIDSDYGFALYPPKAPSVLYRSINRKDSTRLFILFDREQVSAALPGNTSQELTVVTKLNTGQYLFAADTVKIIEPSTNKKVQARPNPRQNTSSPSGKRQTRPRLQPENSPRRKPNVPIPR